MNVFLAPHNDDEALFGAFACIEHSPLVIVCLRSFVEFGWEPSVSFETRELETAASCEVLGCEYEQWDFPDSAPDWGLVKRALQELGDPTRVWAPFPEPGGHQHHNVIGSLAGALWPQTIYYSTYTHARGKTTTGTRVQPRNGWVERKREAMSCYVSQATHPQCAVAFSEWAIDEYLL